MKKFILLALLSCFAGSIFALVDETFTQNGITYIVTQEDTTTQTFEVKAIHYDSAFIHIPDSVDNGSIKYEITSAIDIYSSKNCGLRHYEKIDLSTAYHIINLPFQISALIAIDTLILPPNIEIFPVVYTIDSLIDIDSDFHARYDNISKQFDLSQNDYLLDNYFHNKYELYDENNLLPGIHRVYSTGTSSLESICLTRCTSLLEADLSSYTSTLEKLVSNNSKERRFGSNPFLQKIILPNTIKCFGTRMFADDFKLIEFNTPDSLVLIRDYIGSNISKESFRIGRNVVLINPDFAFDWYTLQSVEVDEANPYFVADQGVLYTKDTTTLYHFPNSYNDSTYTLPLCTDTIEAYASANDYPRLKQQEYDIQNNRKFKNLICNPNLKCIDFWAFYGSSIQQIKNFENTQVDAIMSSAFSGSMLKEIIIPPSLKKIYTLVFSYSQLEKIDFSQSTQIEHIGNATFSGCYKLKEINLLNCTKLKTITRDLCAYDSALEYVALPRYVEKINDRAFLYCSGLKQIICTAAVPIAINANVFEGVDKEKCELIVPNQSIELYKEAEVWKEFFNIKSNDLYYLTAEVSNTLGGSVEGSGAYFYGENVTLTATPNRGYRFVGWAFTDQTDETINFTMPAEDKTMTAIFELIGNKLEDQTLPTNHSQKVIIDGQVYINKDEELFTPLGAKVK